MSLQLRKGHSKPVRESYIRQRLMTASDPSLQRRAMLLGAAALGFSGCDRRRSDPLPTAPDPSVPRAPEVDMRVVTLLGDSITAGYGLPSRDALPSRLEQTLLDLGAKVRVRAAGVSGDTSAGGLARVDFSVQDDTDLCVVALGGNDLLQGIEPATMRSNLTALLDRLEIRKIPVLLAGMRAPPSYGRYAEEFDRVFVALARSRGVDFYPFLLEGVALDSRLNQADGIHPNAKGVETIARGLAPLVILALERTTAI